MAEANKAFAHFRA